MELAQKNKFQELVMNNTWIKTVLMFLLTLGGLFVTSVSVNAEESSHPQEGQVVRLYSNGGQYSTNPNIQPKKSLFSYMLRSKNQGYSTPETYWYNGKWTHYINVDGHVVWCMNPELYPPYGNKYTYHEVTPTGTYHVLYWATEYGYTNKDTYYAEAYAGLNWGIGKLPSYGNAPTELTVSSPDNYAYYDTNYKGQVTDWIKTNINSGHIDNSWTQTLDLPDGVTLVTESDGRRYQNSATIPISERYYFYGDEKLEGNYTINISTNINRYSWWMYMPDFANTQRLLSVWKEGQFSTSVDVHFESYIPLEGYELKLAKKDSEGNYVPGVTFEVSYDKSFTGATWTYATESDGTITIPKWKGDTLFVREVDAPDYLIKSDEVKKIVLRADRVNELEFVNQIQYKLKLIKKDTKGNYVPNVTFEVSYNEDFSDQKWTYETGEDGTVTIPGWKGKTVYVREIDVPDHLILSDQVKKVILEANTTNEVVFVNRTKSDLAIVKKDTEGNYVPNVTFEVSYNEDFSDQKWTYETGEDGTTIIPNWAGKKVYVREVKVPDYLVKSDEVKSIELSPDKVNEVLFINQIQYKLKLTKKDTEGHYVPNVTFEVSDNEDFSGQKWTYETGTDGTVDVPKLLHKTVYVREVKVPDYLQKSNEVKKVTLQANTINEVEFVNQVKYDLKVTKKDTEGHYVPNVTFEVSDNEDFSGQKWTYTTGKDGTVDIPNLLSKTVYVREVKVPDHLVLSNEVKKVTLEAKKVNEVEFINQIQYKLKLIKKDTKGNYVPNVTFEVSYNEDFTVNTWRYTTGADGTVDIPNLLSKTVYVRELNVPDHLVLSNEVKKVTLEAKKINEVEFINKIKGGIKIVKKDGETNIPLADAVFAIKNMKTNEEIIVTTNMKGEATQTNLQDGAYEIREIQAPEKYKLNDQVYSVVVTAGKTTIVQATNISQKGKIAIKKTFDEDLETGEKVVASDVTFEIFNKEDMKKVDTIVTNAEGYAESKLLLLGTYIVHEVTPIGYKPTKDFEVVITEDNKVYTYEITNEVKKSFLKIVKKDAETGKLIPFAGVKFELYRDENTKIGTYTTDETGSVTLPEAVRFGSYLLKEVQAPEGYVLDDKFIPITINGEEVTVTTEVTDNAQKGLLILNKKAKLLTNWTENSDKVMIPVFEEKYLAGTTWELRAKEDILSGDKVTVLYHKGDVVQTLTTSENGGDKFNQVPLGKYELEEVATLPQYVKDTTIYDITFTPQEQTVEVDSQVKNAYNKRKTINVTFNKYFEESQLFTNSKEATFGLFNAETYTENGVTLPADSMIGKFTITQKHKEPEAPKQPIEVEKETIETLETKDLEPTEAEIATEETTQPDVAVEDTANQENQAPTNNKENEQVMVQGSFNDISVDGKLYIRELSTSERYVLDNTNHDITVDFSEMTDEVTVETVVTPIENELKRGGIELVKIEMGSETENRLDGAEYKLVAVDDMKGETEVGRFTTVDGMIHIDDLEYGHYYLEETKAPEGFILDSTRIVVELFGNQNHIIKQIFAENEKIPLVETTMMEQGTNNKEIHAEKVTLVDVVAYKDLIVGQEYTVNGQVVNKATQEVIATSSVTFVAEQRNGTVDVVFEVDASKLQGQDIVAFESLNHNGVEIAVHNDLEDKDQTIKVTKPEVKTTLMEQGTNNKEIHAEKTTLVDVVAYKDLIIGQEYTVNGQVVNKATGEVIVTSSVTFVAEQKDGTVNVVFEVDASKLAGQDIVAFESLSHNGVEIAVHNDLEDKDQTIKVTKPEVKTTMMEQGTNNKEIHAEKTTLVDVVAYKDLIVGQEYTVNGQVVNKESGEVIATSSVTFVAEQKDGTVNVVFEVDASKLAGQDIVAFESLSHNGVEIVVHNDLEDKDQTITVTHPEVKTTMMEQGTNNKEIHAEKVTLVDVVAYKDLIIGQEYTVNGQVVNKATQEVIATSSVTFVAEQRNGTVDVVFEVDASKLQGQDIVAFESLSHNGVEVAVHNDLEDKDQTITVTHPEVKTTMMEQGTNNKEIHAEKVTLVDVVAYKDLIIGQEYTVNGQVVNKATQEVIATSSVTFVAEQRNGTVDVVFEVDASKLQGQDIVAFESLSHNGVEIAVHNDLEDKDQTIKVTKPEVKTTLMEQGTNNKEIHAEKITLVDVVAYKDLIVGQEYTVNGQVVNKATQEVIATSSVTFVAEQKDGTVNVVFEMDASKLAGQDIVAFESLSHNGVEIAVHNDLEDKDQTIKVTKPEVKTTMMEQGTNNKEIHAEKVTLVDVVAYKDLIIGQEYTVNGQVVNKETGEVIATSSVTFVAEQKDGTVNVVFEVDASKLAGKDIVAFESLSHNGVKIAVHNDLEDKDQTVKVLKQEGLPQTSTKSSVAMVCVALLLMLLGTTEYLRYKTNRK